MAETVEAGMIGHIMANAEVAAAVGTRVYPRMIQQGDDLPAVTCQRIDGPRTHHLRGADTLVAARIQVDCWSIRYAEVKSLGDAIRLSLDGWYGTWNNITVDSVLLLDENDIPLQPEPASETAVQRVSMDFRVAHHEVVADFF